MTEQLLRLASLIPTLFFLFILSHNAGGQTKQRAQSAGPSSVVFVVEKWENNEAQIDPAVVVSGNGRFAPPPAGLDGEEGGAASPSRKFINEYYQPGRQYRLLFGGGEAGKVDVIREIEPACVSITASVKVQGAVKLGGEVRALATNSKIFGGQSNARRAPTEEERAAALNLARAAFKQRRVAAPLLAKMETINLTAVDLDRDNQSELIGSFTIQGSDGALYALFMIAEQKGSGLQPALAWYNYGVEAEVQSRRLVDVLDLNKDGLAEVIVMGSYYESHDYFIYQKIKNKWQPVYQGGGGGC